MSGALDSDLDLLNGKILPLEKDVLIEYQKLSKTIISMHSTLEQVNNSVNVIVESVDDNITENLSDTIQELEREMSMLNGAFKNAVHKVLVNEDVNAVETS